VCGPSGLIAAVIEAARASGWPADAVHYELFTGTLAQSGDRTFRVTVADTGTSCEVRPGQTMLEVLEQAGVPVLSDCRRGECGVCMTRVIRGVPDHRDGCLTESERAAGQLICPCVSRSLSEEIVIQL
jgi:vanillate O-demethylase ferredoxin subunit